MQAPSSPPQETEGIRLLNQESLVDADDAVTVVMEPGQVTGTCTRTPRDSVNTQRERADSSSGRANESGEGEGDALIEKSK